MHRFQPPVAEMVTLFDVATPTIQTLLAVVGNIEKVQLVPAVQWLPEAMGPVACRNVHPGFSMPELKPDATYCGSDAANAPGPHKSRMIERSDFFMLSLPRYCSVSGR